MMFRLMTFTEFEPLSWRGTTLDKGEVELESGLYGFHPVLKFESIRWRTM
jgi:hypothetical protein